MLWSFSWENMTSVSAIKKKYQQIKHCLNEKSRRLWCATEALAIGKKGVAIVHATTQITRPTIYAGIRKIQKKCSRKKRRRYNKKEDTRVRKKGGGAKSAPNKMPGIQTALETLVEPATKGDPECPLRWTNK